MSRPRLAGGRSLGAGAARSDALGVRARLAAPPRLARPRGRWAPRAAKSARRPAGGLRARAPTATAPRSVGMSERALQAPIQRITRASGSVGDGARSRRIPRGLPDRLPHRKIGSEEVGPFAFWGDVTATAANRSAGVAGTVGAQEWRPSGGDGRRWAFRYTARSRQRARRQREQSWHLRMRCRAPLAHVALCYGVDSHG